MLINAQSMEACNRKEISKVSSTSMFYDGNKFVWQLKGDARTFGLSECLMWNPNRNGLMKYLVLYEH